MSILDTIGRRVAKALSATDPVREAELRVSEAALGRQARAHAPVIWLVGKTGSGKSAIVAALTGDARAAVGEGFEPCTKDAAFYDFPPDVPVVRFLDTRGLEEAGYDPAEDLAWCEGQAHVLLAVMRADDPAQDSLLATLRAARRRHADWPVLVAQTALHGLYPAGARHPEAYGFAGDASDDSNDAIPRDLRRALAHQRGLLDGLAGASPRFVPIDFTRPGDGYDPRDFGREALLAAIGGAGLDSLSQLLRTLASDHADSLRRGCRPLVWGYAAAAAGGAAVPVPFVDVAALTTANALMLRGLAARYGVTWTSGAVGQFFGAVGVTALAGWGLRYGLRELLKLVPVVGTVAGAALNGAAALSFTVGLGEAACVWLQGMREGRTSARDDIRAAFAAGFRRARDSKGRV